MKKQSFNFGDRVKGNQAPWLGLEGEVTKIVTPSNNWLYVLNDHAFGTYKALSVVAVLESEVDLITSASPIIDTSSTAMKLLLMSGTGA